MFGRRGLDMTFQSFSVSTDTSAGGFIPDQALVRRVQLARNMRASLFGEDLFGDPAWDILLELYSCELGQRRISVSKVSAASGVPSTTGLRWIGILEERNLAEREKDPRDDRRAWISLTPHGRSLMHRYFTATSVSSLTW